MTKRRVIVSIVAFVFGVVLQEFVACQVQAQALAPSPVGRAIAVTVLGETDLSGTFPLEADGILRNSPLTVSVEQRPDVSSAIYALSSCCLNEGTGARSWGTASHRWPNR